MQQQMMMMIIMTTTRPPTMAPMRVPMAIAPSTKPTVVESPVTPDFKAALMSAVGVATVTFLVETLGAVSFLVGVTVLVAGRVGVEVPVASLLGVYSRVWMNWK